MKNLHIKWVIIFLLALHSLCDKAQGQDIPKKSVKSVFITGVIYDSKTLETLSNTSLKVNEKSSYATDESGRFSFFGSPHDTVVFTYIGYQPITLIVPDTLKSQEYVMGVFMQQQTVKLPVIIILPRIAPTSMIITQVQIDQKTMDIAQNHVDKAVFEGLTKATKVYDADMNAKKTMRTNQMRSENKGMLVTPENGVGLSRQNYQTYNIIYGSPVTTPNRIAKEVITHTESEILQQNYDAIKRSWLKQEAAVDTTTH